MGSVRKRRIFQTLDKKNYQTYNVSTNMTTATVRPKRTKRLNLRATQSEKRLLETAASRQDLTVSEFVLESACSRAEDVLAEERHFALSPERWKAFVSALDRPIQPKPRLRRLLTEPSVLER